MSGSDVARVILMYIDATKWHLTAKWTSWRCQKWLCSISKSFPFNPTSKYWSEDEEWQKKTRSDMFGILEVFVVALQILAFLPHDGSGDNTGLSSGWFSTLTITSSFLFFWIFHLLSVNVTAVLTVYELLWFLSGTGILSPHFHAL